MDAIEIRHVSKTYRIPHERHTSIAERLLSLFRPVTYELFSALRDVSFSVPSGSFVGIIGSNGSGKSTLLKILAGLLVPDEGNVEVRGSLAPLLELGLGFHNELSARENVSLYGTILGYPTSELEERVAAVIEFAELDRFRDAKLKSFSSGMVARLAFATALLADADILLLDEVLAVGDARFQQKCFEAFGTLKKQRRTIVLVSHDLGSVQRFCDHVFWLDEGKLVMDGPAEDVVRNYMEISRQETIDQVAHRKPLKRSGEMLRRFGDQAARFVAGRIEDEEGAQLSSVRSGDRIVLRLTVDFDVVAEEPVFGFGVRQLGALGSHIVYTTNNALLGVRSGRFGPGDRVDITIPFTAALMNGHYTVYAAIADSYRPDGRQAPRFYDWVNDFVTFTVEDSRCHEGLADLQAEFQCATIAAGAATRRQAR